MPLTTAQRHAITIPSQTRASLAAALLLGACVATTPTRADIIFDSFGPAGAFNTSGPNFPISGGSAFLQAVRFVPASTTSVTQVSAALRSMGGNGVSSLIATIVTESAGLPGSTVLWTSSPSIVSTTTAIYTFASPNQATLTVGQPYWLILDGTITSGNAAAAFAGSPSFFGTRAEQIPPGAWSLFAGAPLPAIRIEGAANGACCNTATGGCTTLNSNACAALGLRFDGVSSTCSPSACRACPADFNHSGIRSVQDIFDFLAAYFTGCP